MRIYIATVNYYLNMQTDKKKNGFLNLFFSKLNCVYILFTHIYKYIILICSVYHSFSLKE